MRYEVRMAVAVFHRRLAVDRMRDDPGGFERHHAFDLREIDELALAGQPRVDQGDENRGGTVQTADGVAEGGVAHDRWAIRITHHARQARALFQRRAIGAAIAIGAAGAERRHRHHHELWIELAQNVVAQAELRQHLDRIIVDNNVGIGQQPLGEFEPLRPRQVERDAALVAVHDAVAHRLLVQLFENIGRAAIDAAPPVRILRRLDLDHVGAEIGERPRADRPGPSHREIDNTNTFERKPILPVRPGHRYAHGACCGVRAAKHLLADIGNRSATSRRRAGEALHGTSGEAGLVADHDRDDGATRFLLLVCDQVADVRHRHDRDFSPQAFGEPFLRRALLQLRNELAFDFIDLLQAIDAHEQGRIVAQFVQSEHLTEGAPLRRRYRGDAEPALFGLVDADRKGRPEPVNADPPHDVAARKRLEHDVFGDRDRGLKNTQAMAAAASVLYAAQYR